MAPSSQAAGDLFGGRGADRDGVKECILEAGALMTQGAMARAAEAKVEQAASADGHSVAAGAADVLAWAVAEAQQAPDDYRLWSALQLAGIVLGRTVLRDWAAVWSAAQGGDDGEAIKNFIEGLLMAHAGALASRNGQACLGHLGDVWASVMKLRVGTAVCAGDGAEADRMMEGLHGSLVELATGAQGGGSADVGVATVSRMVVLRTIEEFGLYNKRSQRRGLPLSVHDDLRVRFHTVTLPALWAQSVPAFLGFAAAAWEAPAASGMSDGSALSSPDQWMLFRVIHAMLNWRFIRPVSSTGAELGAMQVDGAPGVLPITCGAAWKAGLEASVGGYSLALAVALMVAEAAQRQRRVEAGGRTGIAVGPFAAMTAHQVDEVGSMASEALLQLCSIFAADDEGWTAGERGEYAASLMRLAFQIAQNVLGTAAGNADHGGALRTAACCVERIVSAVGTTDGLFHAAGLNDIHDQLAGMTEAVVNVAAAFLDNYGDDASEEEQHVSEALERLLRAWAVILNSAFGDVTMRCRLDAAGASEPLAAAVTRVFKCYVTAKVTQQLQGAAGGGAAMLGRGGGGGGGGGNHDADGGAAEHSTEFVASHLQSIGLLAREQPDDTAAFLAQAMAAVVDQLNACIPASMGGRASDDETPPEPPAHVCEALWYLLRIAGHFIADDDQSERPCIPSALCAHAVRAEGELEANGVDDPDERASLLVQNSSFFGLFNSLMTFTRTIEALVRAELDNGMPVTMPPSIVESLVFFLHRHAATYLAADPDMQADYTLGFEHIESIICAAETTLRFVATSLAAYPGERTCVDECIATLKALADKPTLAEWILPQPEVQTFLSVSIGNGHFQLPFDARGALVGLLCSIAAQATPEGDPVAKLDPAYAASCLETPTYATSLILRHRAEPHGVCLVDALAAPAQQAMATQQLDFAAASAAASTLRGVLRHLQNPNVVAEACEVLLPAMTGLSALVGPGSPFGHHLPLNTAVIDMLDTIIDSCSTFLPTPLMDQALTVMHGVVETAVARLQEGFAAAAKQQQQHGQHHQQANNLKSQEEDERCDLLARATRLLLSCATWGAFDLSEPGDESALRHQRVSHFCVRGLVAILGIVWSAPDLLNIPDVGSPIYRLLREVADTHSDALLSLPSASEAEAILWFIRTAVSVADVDLNLSAFGTVSALAKHARRVAVQSGEASGLEARLGDFLDDLWATYVTCAVDVTAVSSFAWAIMSLGGCLGAERTYQSWAQAFATKQQTVNPDSPAGRVIDGMIGGAISSTNFVTKSSQHSSVFAGELSAALAVLRGASVTL